MNILTFETYEEAEKYFIEKSKGQVADMIFQIKPKTFSKPETIRMTRSQPVQHFEINTDYIKENKMNDLVKQHKEYCDNLNKVYAQKNEKYGDSFGISVRNYGYIAALTRISDKFHRMEQLILSGADGSDTDERLEDTLLDTANYCIMTAMEIQNKEGNKNE